MTVLHSILLVVFFAPLSPLREQPTSSPERPRFGVCQREGAKIAGEKPTPAGKVTRAPRKIRDMFPRYPTLPLGTQISAGGVWAGELLLGKDGKVAHVWTIREIRFTPPFPAFNESIVAALRQWEFEPLVVDSRAVPACMTVTMNIDWQ